MIMRILLLCVLACLLTTVGCTTPASDDVAGAAAVPLTETTWRVTQIGDQLVDNPPGDGAATIQLQAENSRVTGFAGCNRMFGDYSLNGETLKFGLVGVTKMACLEEGRMQFESRFLETLSRVAGWKITNSTLELLDGGGRTLATFVATPVAAQ
jgi:heat shock protein HslJ